MIAVAVAAPRPQQDESQAEIVNYTVEENVEGGINWRLETSNGIQREEYGRVRNAGTDDEFYIINGGWSFVGPDGVTYRIKFIADENGFRPRGEHLPDTAASTKVKSVDEDDEDDLPPPAAIPQSALVSLVG